MSSYGNQLRESRRNREIVLRNQEPPPTSQHHQSQSHSGSPQPRFHRKLDEKDAEANLLNFVDFLSEEGVNVEPQVPLNDAKMVGLGSTMEVHSITWKGKQVAVKRMRRDKMPTRSANLSYEHDNAFAIAARDFYGDVKSMMQEILVMSRVGNLGVEACYQCRFDSISRSHYRTIETLCISWPFLGTMVRDTGTIISFLHSWLLSLPMRIHQL